MSKISHTDINHVQYMCLKVTIIICFKQSLYDVKVKVNVTLLLSSVIESMPIMDKCAVSSM